MKPRHAAPHKGRPLWAKWLAGAGVLAMVAAGGSRLAAQADDPQPAPEAPGVSIFVRVEAACNTAAWGIEVRGDAAPSELFRDINGTGPQRRDFKLSGTDRLDDDASTVAYRVGYVVDGVMLYQESAPVDLNRCATTPARGTTPAPSMDPTQAAPRNARTGAATATPTPSPAAERRGLAQTGR